MYSITKCNFVLERLIEYYNELSKASSGKQSSRLLFESMVYSSDFLGPAGSYLIAASVAIPNTRRTLDSQHSVTQSLADKPFHHDGKPKRLFSEPLPMAFHKQSSNYYILCQLTLKTTLIQIPISLYQQYLHQRTLKPLGDEMNPMTPVKTQRSNLRGIRKGNLSALHRIPDLHRNPHGILFKNLTTLIGLTLIILTFETQVSLVLGF